MIDPHCFDCQQVTGGCFIHSQQVTTFRFPPETPQQPFRCPLCNGTGRLDAIYEVRMPSDCHGCKGSGIIWGPPK